MSIFVKANIYYFLISVALFGVEVGVIHAADYFDQIVLLFIFGPLALFLAILLITYLVTGIRCPKCNNIYGVTTFPRGWPRVPKKCQSCGNSG